MSLIEALGRHIQSTARDLDARDLVFDRQTADTLIRTMRAGLGEHGLPRIADSLGGHADDGHPAKLVLHILRRMRPDDMRTLFGLTEEDCRMLVNKALNDAALIEAIPAWRNPNLAGLSWSLRSTLIELLESATGRPHYEALRPLLDKVLTDAGPNFTFYVRDILDVRDDFPESWIDEIWHRFQAYHDSSFELGIIAFCVLSQRNCTRAIAEAILRRKQEFYEPEVLITPLLASPAWGDRFRLFSVRKDILAWIHSKYTSDSDIDSYLVRVGAVAAGMLSNPLLTLEDLRVVFDGAIRFAAPGTGAVRGTGR